MITNNAPGSPGSRGVGYMVGFVFFIVGLSMFGRGNAAGGFTFLILGVVFLLSGQPGLNGKKAGRGTDGFPPEAQAREEQADTERKLRKEALAPDGRNRAPTAPAASPAQQRTGRHPEMTRTANGLEAHMTANEISQRREELKGLLDSGIITKEEYYDRLRRLN